MKSYQLLGSKMMTELEFNIDFQMKRHILKRYDDKEIKLGQRISLVKSTKNLFNGDFKFADLIITEELIKRLRTEMRNSW